MSAQLHPAQVLDRKLLHAAIPDPEQRDAALISLAKAASNLAVFLAKVREFVDVPQETAYRAAIIINNCMAIWKPTDEPAEVRIQRYLPELGKADLDARFAQIVQALYDEAIKRKLIARPKGKLDMRQKNYENIQTLREEIREKALWLKTDSRKEFLNSCDEILGEMLAKFTVI